MLKTFISAVAIVLPLGTAFAQSPHLQSSDVDVHASSMIGGAPGTIGAMDAAARGVATSADDVVMQQQGRSTAADGYRRVTGPIRAGYPAGTVGATPGN